MTNAARRDLPVPGLRLLTVALVARDMRVESRRNRHSYSAATGPMTSSTTNAAHSRVAPMIEFHVEAAQAGECLQLAGLRVRVTDRAYRAGRIRELLSMTSGAR